MKLYLTSAIFLLSLFLSTTSAAVVVAQNNLEETLWTPCTKPNCAGTHGVATAHNNLVQTPSLDGKAQQFSLQNISGWGGYLWYQRLQPFNAATHWTLDYYLQVSDPSAAQAIEIDGNQGTATHRIVYGTECNYRPTGHWRLWYWTGSKGAWQDTNIPCSFTTANHWYHVIVTFARAANDAIHYEHISATDMSTGIVVTQADINQTLAAKPQADPKENSVDIQLDGHGSAGYSVFLDKFNVGRF